MWLCVYFVVQPKMYSRAHTFVYLCRWRWFLYMFACVCVITLFAQIFFSYSLSRSLSLKALCIQRKRWILFPISFELLSFCFFFARIAQCTQKHIISNSTSWSRTRARNNQLDRFFPFFRLHFLPFFSHKRT